MQLKLEELPYQSNAVQSVVKVFDGTERNSLENSSSEGIRRNLLTLSPDHIRKNLEQVIAENGIAPEEAKLARIRDLCVEMETGTGKTLVYVKTIYDLHKHYGWTKFIILVPSIAIRQGVLSTLSTFRKQLEDIYGFAPDHFEYDSKKLNKVKTFAEDQHPQIMIATTQAITGEDRIINREEREGLFDGIAYIDAIARTNPVVIMDEPQEGMDATETSKAINRLNPLVKLRYSATHKELRNLVYRLTPYQSYKQNLVKKIQLCTVTELNDDATMKVELAEVKESSANPQVKLRAFKQLARGFSFTTTSWLKNGDDLREKTNNPIYEGYKIAQIKHPIMQNWRVRFENGAEIEKGATSANKEAIWELQLEWLIRMHFTKSAQLNPKGIKCLSLIFIDKVANYTNPQDPKIKNLFVKKYRELYSEYKEGEATDEYIESIQGFYFAKTQAGEYTDNETSIKKNSEIYNLILNDRETLLSLDNPVQFIFSHSALGVGWDNPNVFTIATLNNTYSEITKRQEIGRGLRICVNQNGERVYDRPEVGDDERINQLTVVPNEAGKSFIAQYQGEVAAIYGSTAESAVITQTHKGKKEGAIKFRVNRDASIQRAFKEFWKKMARKTDYVVSFEEELLVKDCIVALSEIDIQGYKAKVQLTAVDDLETDEHRDLGWETYELKGNFAPIDIIEEISENTQLSYDTIFRIVSGIENKTHWIKNPPLFVHLAVNAIKRVELDAMVRGVRYETTGEMIEFTPEDFEKQVDETRVANTPRRGLWDRMIVDSRTIEKPFAEVADASPDNDVLCVLKLPAEYVIPTPVGQYYPDFGIVLCKRKGIRGREEDLHFVVEMKGTHDLNDVKSITENERYKIKCAIEHFRALGVIHNYVAPVDTYDHFHRRAEHAFDIKQKLSHLHNPKSETDSAR